MSVNISALAASIFSANARKRKLTDDYNKEIAQIDAELQRMQDALKVLNEAVAPYTCPSCNGEGNVTYTDAAGGRDWDTCKSCGGTGVRRDV